jgi:predicted ester cyclase
MTSQRAGQLRRLAESYTAAWCSQNAARVAGFYSLDGSLRVNADPLAVGRNAIAGVVQGFMAAFPNLNVIMDDIVIDGDQAVYCWTLVGTNTGPGGTGKRVHISGFEEWRIGADGLIAESRGHFDSAEYQRQLEPGVNGVPSTTFR